VFTPPPLDEHSASVLSRPTHPGADSELAKLRQSKRRCCQGCGQSYFQRWQDEELEPDTGRTDDYLCSSCLLRRRKFYKENVGGSALLGFLSSSAPSRLGSNSHARGSKTLHRNTLSPPHSPNSPNHAGRHFDKVSDHADLCSAAEPSFVAGSNSSPVQRGHAGASLPTLAPTPTFASPQVCGRTKISICLISSYIFA
jgi:hypothetical protein